MSESSSANPQQQAQQTPGLRLFEDCVDLTTTPNSPSQMQPPNIPAQVLQEACGFLERNILPNYDDSRIRRDLVYIWMGVNRALEHDQKRKECLADHNQFLANVTRKGEQQFIDSLRSMAISGTWAALFDDGTLLSFFDFELSGHLDCLDVFLKEKPRIHQQKASDIVAVKGTQSFKATPQVPHPVR
jgi:hypothetical protein